MKSNLVLNEQPLLVLPSLAKLLGIEHAVVLQQLYWLLQNKNNGKELADGERWIFNTYEQWTEHFPWLSERALRRVFGDLEERGIVLSCQPEGLVSRRKYYRVSVGALAKLNTDQVDQSDHFALSSDEAAKSGASGSGQKARICNTENTSKNQPAAPPRDDLTEKEPKPSLAPLKNALAVIDGSRIDEMTRNAWGRVDAALKQIRSVCPEVTPEEIVRRARNYQAQMPGISISPNALALHWAKLGTSIASPISAAPSARIGKDVL
jgi:hypothetical protein